MHSSSFPFPSEAPIRSVVRGLGGKRGPGVGDCCTWSCPRVGLLPDHYKHGEFLCLSCPPCSAQREGVAPGKYPEVCLSTPFPCGVTLSWGWGWLQCTEVAWGFMGGGSSLATPSSRLPLAHPTWILSSSLSWGPGHDPILQRTLAGGWRMGQVGSERGQGEE